MSELERKQLAFTGVKLAGGSGPGEFSGYGAVFGNVDLGGDRIVRGAFADDLSRFLEAGLVAWSHNQAEPIAIPLAVAEDDRGLFLRAQFHTTELAQKARRIVSERLAAAKSFGLSIGYTILPGGARRAVDGVRELTKLRLHEVSLVSVPMNPAAVVTSVKSGTHTWDASESALAQRARFFTSGYVPGSVPYVYVEAGDLRAAAIAVKCAASLRVQTPAVRFFRYASVNDLRRDAVDFWAQPLLLGRALTKEFAIALYAGLADGSLGSLGGLVDVVGHEVAHLAGADEEQATQFETIARRIAAGAA